MKEVPLQPAGTKFDVDLYVSRVGKFKFEDYTLVRLSAIGSHRGIEISQMLDVITAALNEVLSAEELPDKT